MCGRGMVGRHSVYFTLHSLSVAPVGPDSSKGGEGTSCVGEVW